MSDKGLKLDCFALGVSPAGRCDCVALNTLECAKGRPCSFYATKEQVREAQAKAAERARRLGYDPLHYVPRG